MQIKGFFGEKCCNTEVIHDVAKYEDINWKSLSDNVAVEMSNEVNRSTRTLLT